MTESSNNSDLSTDDLKDVSGGASPSNKLHSDYDPKMAHDKTKTVKKVTMDPSGKMKDNKNNLIGDSNVF